MNQPLLSVIIPAKDQAPFIRDAMTSLTRQFDDPSVMEIIVIDDGSTDGTGALAAAFTGRLPGLQVHRNDIPLGVASARNRGLDHATGRFITFFDPDDWYAPGHLAKITADIAALEVDFLRVDHIRHANGNRSLQRAPQARRGVRLDPRESIMPETAATMVDYPYSWAGIFSSALAASGLLHFPEGQHTAEDRAWIWRLHLGARSYAVVNAPGILYRRGVSSSLTQIYDERQLDFLTAFLDIFGIVGDDAEAGRFWPKAVRQFFAIACHHLKRAPGMEAWIREDLTLGIEATMRRIPAKVREESLQTLDVERRKILTNLMERSVL
ncbi:glycosyltransferase family 2 protein [Arthrobacter sp. NPDC089319]|uniref:glycosyltransferase family 2 protein n=1 Tax=Arthrobacter sp. NPDC089319 TaxID=3155915 RepID=UPI0034383ACC